jgi:serine phosphatase RsbU (regulator of sigma subunit)
MLMLDQLARYNAIALLFLLLLPAAGASLLLLDADPLISTVFGTSLVMAFVAASGLYHITRNPRRFRVWALAVIFLAVALATLAATAFFGLFSAAVLVAVLLILISALGQFRSSWLTMWAVYAGARLLLVLLDATGVLPERGLIVAALAPSEKLTIEVLIQALLGISLISGRMAARSTEAKVTWLLQNVREAAQRELEIAGGIQTAMLPRQIHAAGFEIAAGMVPAAVIGGDYYDVRPTEDGCWIAIGDVSGHGLQAGLVMMMVQTSVVSFTLDDAHAVDEVVDRVNRVLYENIRHRLGETDYVTFSIARLRRDGQLTIAGAHEPVIIHRAATGVCELIEVAGTWLGVLPSVADVTEPLELQLEPGDTVILYSDGVTEAANAARERFGLDRLTRSIERLAERPVAEVQAQVAQEVIAFTHRQEDDMTLLAVRYRG